MQETPTTTAVYDAEHVWRDRCVIAELLAESEANALARRIYSTHAEGLYWDGAAFVRQGEAMSDLHDAHADDEGTITVQAFPVEAATIIHECAHVVAGLHDDDEPDDDAHGEQFRTWHLRLVGTLYGQDAAELLAELYDEHLRVENTTSAAP